MVLQRLTGSYCKTVRFPRLSFPCIHCQWGDIFTMRKNDRTVCIYFYHTIGILHRFSAINTYMVQMSSRSRRFHIRQNHNRTFRINNVKYCSVSKRIRGSNHIIHISVQSNSPAYLTDCFSCITSHHKG